MSTQQDIYAAGSENRPPMLNKENYVPWSSRLLRYAKSRPNRKFIHNSIINGPYVRRMIPELGDPNREVPVNETFHVQTDDELTEKELKQIEADDQAIQTILLGLPEDIYAAEKKAKLFNEWERFTSNDGESIESYYHRFLKLMNDLKRNKHFPEKIASNLKFLNNLKPEWSRHVTIVHQTKDLHTADYTQLYDFLKYNQKENYMQQPMPNLEDITDPTTAMNMELALMAKAFKLNYSTPTNNNQRISSNQRNRQIAQPGMNMGQDRQMQMVGARAEGNATGHNGNQIRCYNCRGVGHFARNCTVRPKRKDAAADLDEIKEVNANCILIAKLQQALISGTQTDKAPIYDSDGSAEVHNYKNCYDNEIFNMFTQKEQYTELLEPIPEPHQVPQNDNNVISEVSSVKQSGGTVEQHPVNVDETRVLYDSLYQNLAIKVKKVNTVNRKLKETNAELTTKLARFKNEEKCFEISQEKYNKLERCYQQSVYQEKCLSKKINAIHLSSEKKKLKSDFKIRKDELLDKQIQLEKRIKELDNILVKTGQSIQMIHMLSPKPDSFYHTKQKMALGYQNPLYLKQAQKKQQSLYDGKVLLEKHDPPVVHDSEETLQLAQESRQKMKQLNKEIKPANYTKINHLSGVFVSQTAKSREELYFSNASKTANVSKPISIPNEEFSDDTTPSIACKFLNEVKSTIVTLQRVVKHRMSLETHNWSSSAHQELHKIVKDEDFPIVNQVNARLQNFEIQFLKEVAKFIGDFKSLAKEADESLVKHKALELEIERLLKAVASQDIISLVQNNSVVDTSNLQTELERMKEHFENCIIKNENEYAKLWNDWINPVKPSREEKHVPNNARASVRTKPITVSQPPVIVKKVVNSDSNGFSSTGVENTKTRRPQSRSNTKNDRVLSASKSSQSKNKEVEVEEHHRKLLLFKNKKHMSSECNKIKLATQNVYSKVVCAMCKQCLISVNHDVCLLNYVNDKNSRGKQQTTNVSIKEKQKQQKPKVKKPKKVGSIERLATPKPSKPRSFLRWSPAERMFDLKGKIITSSKSESQSDYSKGDNACTSNPMEPKIKRFQNSTFSLACNSNMFMVHRLGLFQAYDQKSKASHQFRLEVFGNSIATVCFTQNRSIIHRQFNKTPYELINDRKPDISFLHVFGALYYPKNDREDTGKLGAKGDIGFFISYSADSCAYRVYNGRTKKSMETMNVSFDELFVMAFEQCSSKPGLQGMTSGQINSGLDLTYAPSTITNQQPTEDTAPTPTNSSSQATNFTISSQDVDELNLQQQHVQQQGNQASP
nr:integrase, catalytic region, zinc finger, CCHC-type, peptidase aspartic, catalytic [Tanacetum cinerariifolium]